MDSFKDEETARIFVERKLWPHGPVCPGCQSVNKSSRHGRDPKRGQWVCGVCSGYYSWRTGTVFSSSTLGAYEVTRLFAAYARKGRAPSSLDIASAVGLSVRSVDAVARRAERALERGSIYASSDGVSANGGAVLEPKAKLEDNDLRSARAEIGRLGGVARWASVPKGERQNAMRTIRARRTYAPENKALTDSERAAIEAFAGGYGKALSRPSQPSKTAPPPRLPILAERLRQGFEMVRGGASIEAAYTAVRCGATNFGVYMRQRWARGETEGWWAPTARWIRACGGDAAARAMALRGETLDSEKYGVTDHEGPELMEAMAFVIEAGLTLQEAAKRTGCDAGTLSLRLRQRADAGENMGFYRDAMLRSRLNAAVRGGETRRKSREERDT